MLTETGDRDAIVANAIDIASAEARAAYIARACGNDPALMRQVEELVAAHFQAGSAEQPAVAAIPGSRSRGRDLEKTSGSVADNREASEQRRGDMQRYFDIETVEASKMNQKKPRGLVTIGALLVLVASAVGAGASLAVWKINQGPLQQELDRAKHEASEARKTEAELKQQRDQALAAREASEKERDEAVATEREAQTSAEDAKAVLNFLQNNLLSVAHPLGWGNDVSKKDVKLLQAVDAAAARIVGAFPEKPLVEASVREIFGSTYLDMGDASKAVKEFGRSLSLREAVLGPDHSESVDCRNKLAVAYRLDGHAEKASALYEQDPESPAHAAALAVQGSMLLAHKHPMQAEEKLREALAIRQKIQPDEWTTFDTKAMVGAALLEQKKFAEAEQMLVSGYEGMKERQSKIPSQDKNRLTRALERLVRLYKSWDKKDQVAKWQKEMDRTEASKKL